MSDDELEAIVLSQSLELLGEGNKLTEDLASPSLGALIDRLSGLGRRELELVAMSAVWRVMGDVAREDASSPEDAEKTLAAWILREPHFDPEAVPEKRAPSSQ